MGHERIGFLPTTKPWTKVVEQVSSFSGKEEEISRVAKTTLDNVQSRFKYIENDGGVISAFHFLVLYALAGRSEDPIAFLAKYGINLSQRPSIIEISKEVSKIITDNIHSKEYAALAKSSAIDAISEWQLKHSIVQSSLFSTDINKEQWKKASYGSGFCEIARLFFASFTERYLKYFLERAASSTINSVYERELFNDRLESHVNDISRHAFDTAKITQSFAAGWFNKNTKEGVPTERMTKNFLRKAFSKMRSEILIQGEVING